MPRTINNAEQIAFHIAKYGPENIRVHKIQSTQFWLVAIAKTADSWKLFVCDPMKTSHRLVTQNPIPTYEYMALWAILTSDKIKIESNMTNVAKEYKKYTEDYYKNKNKKHHD